LILRKSMRRGYINQGLHGIRQKTLNGGEGVTTRSGQITPNLRKGRIKARGGRAPSLMVMKSEGERALHMLAIKREKPDGRRGKMVSPRGGTGVLYPQPNSGECKGRNEHNRCKGEPTDSSLGSRDVLKGKDHEMRKLAARGRKR